jgi:hypothetical protein
LRNHLKAAGINVEGDLEQLAKNKQVKEYLLKELRSTGQKAGLKGPEILQDIIVSGELWTPEGGQLTAANKIQRKVIVKQFEKEIKVSVRLRLLAGTVLPNSYPYAFCLASQIGDLREILDARSCHLDSAFLLSCSSRIHISRPAILVSVVLEVSCLNSRARCHSIPTVETHMHIFEILRRDVFVFRAGISLQTLMFMGNIESSMYVFTKANLLVPARLSNTSDHGTGLSAFFSRRRASCHRIVTI